MVVIPLKVLVSRHDEIGSRMRGRELDKQAIGRIAHALPAMAGLRKLGDGSEDSQKLKGRDSRIPKAGLQARAVQHFFELGECRVAHDRDDLAAQDGVDDLAGGPEREIKPDTSTLVSITTRTRLSYFGDELIDLCRRRSAPLGGRPAERVHHAPELLAGRLAFCGFYDEHVDAALDAYLCAESLQPFGRNQESFLGVARVTHISA